MGNILDDIVARKRADLARIMAEAPLDEVKAHAQEADAPRDFFAALTRPSPHGIHLIAEIKRRSPSAGMIRPDFDPAGIARVYAESGASAISVLTDGPYFDGSLDHLRNARQAVSLPVLRKDFVVDEYQLWEARAAGADAVLLIAEVLGPAQAVELARVAVDLGMSALIESYRAKLLQEVLTGFGNRLPRGVLLGINNRDLASQRVDLGVTRRVASTLPAGTALVAESGVRSRQDALSVADAGACAMLVGEAIMSARDMGAKIRELLAAGR